MRPLRVAEQLPERDAVVDDPPGERQLPVRIDDRDLRTPPLPLLTVGPPLELSGRAGAIRAVSNHLISARSLARDG